MSTSLATHTSQGSQGQRDQSSNETHPTPIRRLSLPLQRGNSQIETTISYSTDPSKHNILIGYQADPSTHHISMQYASLHLDSESVGLAGLAIKIKARIDESLWEKHINKREISGDTAASVSTADSVD